MAENVAEWLHRKARDADIDDACNLVAAAVALEQIPEIVQQRDRLLEGVKDLNFGILGTQTGVAGRDDATKVAVLWERAQAGYEEMHGLYKLALEIEEEMKRG